MALSSGKNYFIFKKVNTAQEMAAWDFSHTQDMLKSQDIFSFCSVFESTVASEICLHLQIVIVDQFGSLLAVAQLYLQGIFKDALQMEPSERNSWIRNIQTIMNLLCNIPRFVLYDMEYCRILEKHMSTFQREYNEFKENNPKIICDPIQFSTVNDLSNLYNYEDFAKSTSIANPFRFLNIPIFCLAKQFGLFEPCEEKTFKKITSKLFLPPSIINLFNLVSEEMFCQHLKDAQNENLLCFLDVQKSYEDTGKFDEFVVSFCMVSPDGNQTNFSIDLGSLFNQSDKYSETKILHYLCGFLQNGCIVVGIEIFNDIDLLRKFLRNLCDNHLLEFGDCERTFCEQWPSRCWELTHFLDKCGLNACTDKLLPDSFLPNVSFVFSELEKCKKISLFNYRAVYPFAVLKEKLHEFKTLSSIFDFLPELLKQTDNLMQFLSDVPSICNNLQELLRELNFNCKEDYVSGAKYYNWCNQFIIEDVDSFKQLDVSFLKKESKIALLCGGLDVEKTNKIGEKDDRVSLLQLFIFIKAENSDCFSTAYLFRLGKIMDECANIAGNPDSSKVLFKIKEFVSNLGSLGCLFSGADIENDKAALQISFNNFISKIGNEAKLGCNSNVLPVGSAHREVCDFMHDLIRSINQGNIQKVFSSTEMYSKKLLELYNKCKNQQSSSFLFEMECLMRNIRKWSLYFDTQLYVNKIKQNASVCLESRDFLFANGLENRELTSTCAFNLHLNEFAKISPYKKKDVIKVLLSAVDVFEKLYKEEESSSLKNVTHEKENLNVVEDILNKFQEKDIRFVDLSKELIGLKRFHRVKNGVSYSLDEMTKMLFNKETHHKQLYSYLKAAFTTCWDENDNSAMSFNRPILSRYQSLYGFCDAVYSFGCLWKAMNGDLEKLCKVVHSAETDDVLKLGEKPVDFAAIPSGDTSHFVGNDQNNTSITTSSSVVDAVAEVPDSLVQF